MKTIAVTAIILAAFSLALAAYATVRAIGADLAAQSAAAAARHAVARVATDSVERADTSAPIGAEVAALYATSRAAAESGVSLEIYVARLEFEEAKRNAVKALRELDERGALEPHGINAEEWMRRILEAEPEE